MGGALDRASRSQAHPRSEELQLQRNWWLKQRKALMQDVATDVATEVATEVATDVATGAARTVGFCKKCFLYPVKRKCGFVLDGKQKGAHIVPFFHCSAYSFWWRCLGRPFPQPVRCNAGGLQELYPHGRRGCICRGNELSQLSSDLDFSCLEPSKWMQMEDCTCRLKSQGWSVLINCSNTCKHQCLKSWVRGRLSGFRPVNLNAKQPADCFFSGPPKTTGSRKDLSWSLRAALWSYNLMHCWPGQLPVAPWCHQTCLQ